MVANICVIGQRGQIGWHGRLRGNRWNVQYLRFDKLRNDNELENLRAF
jgi:hypothetical protein